MKKKLLLHFLSLFLLIIIVSFFSMFTTSILSYVFSTIIAEKIFDIKIGSNVIWAVVTAFVPIIIAIILLGVFYVRKISEPFFYFSNWLDQLTNGNHTVPIPHNKKNKKMIFFPLFDEIYLNLKSLTYKLEENKIEREIIDKRRSEWTAGITHDLKTPLSYIQGYTNMIIEQPEQYNKEEMLASMKIMYEKSVHLRELLDELHVTLQLEQGKYSIHKTKANIIPVIETIVLEFQQLPDISHHEILFEFNITNYEWSFNPKAMNRIISNLIMNAIIHNPEKTKIVISCFYNEVQNEFTIKIADNGKGMNEEEQNNMFNRYYRGTTTENTSGTGLGLAITKQLVELHDAVLLVESEVGKGTEIIILF
ncbi:sensor histidine kinase [Lysinibacillus sp. NPDC096418]|uniref:sensor histidine kinase n=1 Tax=Lysinibacillus sp. NPDC096418 TaxID=3364138 RepID=UPI00382D7DB9